MTPSWHSRSSATLGTLLVQANTTLPDKVRELVHVLLPSGMCPVDRVAQHLGVDRRTVHRRLAQEKTSYSDIVNQARASLAVRYIDNRERPLSEVATLPGFSSRSAFSRWVGGHFGCSVSKWRLQQDQARNNM